MEQQTNFTCRVDADLKQAFLRAAKANDRPASVLIRDFMREYVQQSTQGRQASLPFDRRTTDQKGAACYEVRETMDEGEEGPLASLVRLQKANRVD